MMNTDNLNISDKVAYTTSSYSCRPWNILFSIVSRKTPSGQVTLENGWKFLPSGNAMKSDPNPFAEGCLIPVDAAEKRIADHIHQREMDRTVNGLLEALAAHRTGGGNYILSDEIANALQAVTNAIKLSYGD